MEQGILMDLVVPARQYIAVDFPGIVCNVDKAIQMLGGQAKLDEVFADQKKRLHLSFRPNMLFAKPTCGNAESCNSLVLRVQRLRNKITGEVKIIPTILGSIPRIYKFTSMADFQFGPFERVSSESNCFTSDHSKHLDTFRVFYKDLLIEEPTTSLDSYLSRDTPLYLPPTRFTRFDTSIIYNFTPRYRTLDGIEREALNQLQPVSRKPRPSCSWVVTPDMPTPTGAKRGALELTSNIGFAAENLRTVLQKLFNQRPIWLRAALLHQIPQGTTFTLFKQVIVTVAYYMIKGPWSRTWVRFGYDPRLQPESRYYQVLDFRVQSYLLFPKLLHSRNIVTSTNDEHNKATLSKAPNFDDESAAIVENEELAEGHENVDGDNVEEEENEVEEEGTETKLEDINSYESSFRFGPNHYPTSHQQVRYCLIDIDLPEVRAILDEVPERMKPDPVEGWLKSGTLKKIRDFLGEYLKLWISTKDAFTLQSEVT